VIRIGDDGCDLEMYCLFVVDCYLEIRFTIEWIEVLFLFMIDRVDVLFIIIGLMSIWGVERVMVFLGCVCLWGDRVVGVGYWGVG